MVGHYGIINYKYLMKFEVFKEIIARLKKHETQSRVVYSNGIDLFNFEDNLSSVVSMLIGSIYGKDGLNTFEWWCYDKEWGTRDDFKMTDSEENELCSTIEELYNYLEENKKSDYSLKRPLSQEELNNIFSGFFKNNQ